MGRKVADGRFWMWLPGVRLLMEYGPVKVVLCSGLEPYRTCAGVSVRVLRMRVVIWCTGGLRLSIRGPVGIGFLSADVQVCKACPVLKGTVKLLDWIHAFLLTNNVVGRLGGRL
ncbi:hypothetical protein EBH_0083970 [Eimeria brunetti]|uniref:Uncharacterized protein n=1 Tax=Eimeria brunetti TaxID=51314 RepID=U6LY38_9EIME|nr:hypothetical protein EBH_0083970 [Eimeria brunetti]